jgi:hypothetical protein
MAVLVTGGATLVGAGALASPALAGTPGTWNKVSGLGGAARNVDELGLERTVDGVLHIVWRRAGSGNADDLMHTAISADARSVIAPVVITTMSGGLNASPDLLPDGTGGLRVLFSGLAEGQPASGLLSTATAPASGTVWSVSPTPVSNNSAAGRSPVYAAKGIAGVLAGGTVFSAWGDSGPGSGGLHAGLDAGPPDARFDTGCCAVDPALAVDPATSQVVLAWIRLSNPTTSIAVQAFPGGPMLTAPNSGAAESQTRVGLTARIGAPGVYVAYGSGTNQFLATPVLWRVGDSRALVVDKTVGAQSTTIAAAPGGRLWVFWYHGTSLFVTRTNPAATRVGAVVRYSAPEGTRVLYRVVGDGSRGPLLDLFAFADRGTGDFGYYHEQMRAGLTLAAKSSSKKSKAHKLTFTVTDAGDPVFGAAVHGKLGTKTVSAKTNASGKGTLKFASAGVVKATATKPDYLRTTLTVKVK